MSLLVTHIDDDGKASAAIALRELFPFDVRPEAADIVYYNYWHTPIAPDHEFHENEKVVIVDLSLDDWVFNLIKRAVAAGSQVVHIDHHATTQEYIDAMTPDDKAIYDKVRTVYHTKFSATMLCWIWSCAHQDERDSIDNTIANIIDFSEDWKLLVFNPGQGDKERVYKIPDVVRYVDDWDIWRFDIKETKAFHYGFNTELDKNPDSKLWDELLYNYNAPIIVNKRYLEPGHAIEKNLESEYVMLRKMSFEAKIPGFENLTCIVINGLSNSFAFGDLLQAYDVAVIFHYDGPQANWKYSIYSKADGVDVSDIAESFGGGGHPHASGFRTEKNIFVS